MSTAINTTSTITSPSPAWIVPDTVDSGFCVAVPEPISELASTAVVMDGEVELSRHELILDPHEVNVLRL